MRKNSKTKNVTKLKFWQNLRTQIVTKLKILQNLIKKEKKTLKWSFSKNSLTPWQPMRCSLGSVLQFSHCYSGKTVNDQEFLHIQFPRQERLVSNGFQPIPDISSRFPLSSLDRYWVLGALQTLHCTIKKEDCTLRTTYYKLLTTN